MFVGNLQLKLTEPAELDFRDIFSYTLQQWGDQQAALYSAKIDAAFDIIMRNPNVGIRRHGALVYPVGKHKIFYRIHEPTLYIIRILHHRMDPARHLDEHH
jgi:toxin ParE1/3/4